MYKKGFTQFIVLALVAILFLSPILMSTAQGAIFGAFAREGTPAEGSNPENPNLPPNNTGGGTGECTWDAVSQDPPGDNLVNVSVPIWKYSGSSGSLSTMSLRVHQNCADSIMTIFTRIYNDHLLIQTSDTGCYSNRGSGSKSRHNWGVACDVNWNENWCYNCYGQPGNRVGNFWKPGDIEPDRSYEGWVSGFDARSIPINGGIASDFADQNWGRGLYHSFNDFMHFSVDGH